MKRILLFTALFSIVAAPMTAQIGAVAAKAPTSAPRVVPMTLHPASEPKPALKYQLLPDFVDKTPGNAVLMYMTGHLLLPTDMKEPSMDDVSDWIQLPVKDLPLDKVRRLVKEGPSALHQVELGAFRETCDWEQPIRSEGFDLLLPYLSKQRNLAKLLALRARLGIAEGRINDVVHDMQIGFAMARHTADSPILISTLVGVAIGTLMTDQAEALVSCPNCPNLYWALTQLSSPFIDIRRGLEGERFWPIAASPELRNPRKARLTPQQWDDLYLQGAKLMVPNASDAERILHITETVIRVGPKAKRYLSEQGLSPKELEAMPVKQAILIYWMDHYDAMRDRVFKWFALPYWQAKAPVEEANQELEKLAKEKDDSALLGATFLPALHRAHYITTRFDRRIAVLRCIEAIRLYAAAHDRKLPARLEDITEVPIPIDPITGKLFEYKLDGDKAIIEWTTPSTEPRRYELTIAK